MSVRQWMVASVLVLAGIGSAVATDLDAHEVATGSRGAAESSTRDSGGTTGGDLLGLGRDTSSRRSADGDNDADGGSNRGGGSAAGGSEHGGRISAPTSARPAPLGWQSLLPGSIQ
ncbi:MAG TPA: hypothetical protein VFM52_00755 [Rhodanobacter sp.]|nr:hypothetical protein [Rhodanobacter sp.]